MVEKIESSPPNETINLYSNTLLLTIHDPRGHGRFLAFRCLSLAI